MVGLALVGALLSFGDEYAATWVGERFTLALRTRLLSHLQRLEPDALDRRRHGDVLARLTGDVHAIETLLLSAVARARAGPGALGVLRRGAVPAVLEARARVADRRPVFYFAARRFARLARRAARERRRRSGSLTAVAEEASPTPRSCSPPTPRSASWRASAARARARWRPSSPAPGSPACSRR